MKKTTFPMMLTIFALIFLFSCHKRSDLVSSTPQTPYSKILRVSSAEGQKLAFAMMDKKERYEVWAEKIDLLLNKSNFKEEQKAFLTHLKNELSPNVFETGTQENIIFKTSKQEELLKAAEKLFSEQELFTIGYSFQNDQQKALATLPRSAESIDERSCTCNVGSRYTCGRITSVSTSGGTIEYGQCYTGYNPCSSSDMGCGFAFLWSCNGSQCVYS